MPVRFATLEDRGAIFRLLDDARHVRLTMGNEDLEAAIVAGHVLLLWEDEKTQPEVAGMLATVVEKRSSTAPGSTPNRIYLRGVAFRREVSPTIGLQRLLDAFITYGTADPHPRRLIAYGGEGWLDRSLRDAGMTLTDRVQYFALEYLQKRTWPAQSSPIICSIRDATPTDLASLVILDNLIFDPLWHYSQSHLHGALLNGTLLLAHTGSDLIGYCALLLDRANCTIARLAVHPDHQGQGCGRALLLAALQLAQTWGCDRALLNTQATNHRSQQLYRSLGFRPTGESFAVFVLDLPASSHREVAQHMA